MYIGDLLGLAKPFEFCGCAAFAGGFSLLQQVTSDPDYRRAMSL